MLLTTCPFAFNLDFPIYWEYRLYSLSSLEVVLGSSSRGSIRRELGERTVKNEKLEKGVVFIHTEIFPVF